MKIILHLSCNPVKKNTFCRSLFFFLKEREPPGHSPSFACERGGVSRTEAATAAKVGGGECNSNQIIITVELHFFCLTNYLEILTGLYFLDERFGNEQFF